MGRAFDRITPAMRTFVEAQHMLNEWKDNRSQDELEVYWAEKNSVSIDGLPASAD